jgi:hypothetical protein
VTTSSPIPVAVHRPSALALGLVRLASRLLPPPERRRYRWEFVADLHYLDRPHQLAYATGVFSTAWSLRQQLTQEPTMDDTTTTPTIPLLCRLNLRHHWHYVTNPEDGTRSRVCARCGKDDPHLGDVAFILGGPA